MHEQAGVYEDTLIADEEEEIEHLSTAGFTQVVVSGSDWTAETVLSQLVRGNININPGFQRRDAWKRPRKSRFIESLILDLPVPQIILAEKKDARGSFIVLDGKQRLLSILQFTGNAPEEDPNNRFGLSGLEVRDDLRRKRYSQLQSDPELEADLRAFENKTIRTVVIRNWPDLEFLHMVFRRLNTGSVVLSSQELRQAMYPGAYSDFLDSRSADSSGLQQLLGIRCPDPRMRDVELLARHLAFVTRLADYRGRMKNFLDESAEELSSQWDTRESELRQAADQFEMAIEAMISMLGASDAARKPESKNLNKAVLDALAFYLRDEQIRRAVASHQEEFRDAYSSLFATGHRFAEAVESDTAGIPNTFARLDEMASLLKRVTGLDVPSPELVEDPMDSEKTRRRIVHAGFGT